MADADFNLKAHDVLPSIQAVLSTGGQIVDLTTATAVTFIMRLTGSTGSPKVDAAATVVAPTGGTVRYDWVGTDTDTAGNYQAEWQVTWPGGKKQTFPTIGYHSISIEADLDNA